MIPIVDLRFAILDLRPRISCNEAPPAIREQKHSGK